ncbi:hypothetical protein FPV67DRAFT_1473254 [Lyophyllum atratum]|nr:hypothetical protein FPV67DRAFT_1473254 [Lyophyllum atratum]
MTTYTLPAELWIYIFCLATSTPATQKLFHTDYRPFHDPPGEMGRNALKDADETALALVLVCRAWRRLALEFVYGSIRMNHGMRYLLQSLQSSAKRGSLEAHGRWVRRLELSVIEQEDPLNPVTPLDIIRLCPNVEVLVKYDDDLLPHSLSGANLSSIKRLDWWLARRRDGTHQFDIEEDDRSHGVDFLREVLKRAPNLQYLSLATRRHHADFFYESVTTFNGYTLPSLKTLRMEFLPSIPFRAAFETSTLPSLRNVIIDSSMIQPECSPILENPAIDVVELIDDPGFFEDHTLPAIFSVCKNLRELNYCMEYTPPSLPPSSYPSLKCIRLNVKRNPMLHFASWNNDVVANAVWQHVEGHFAMFRPSNFPSLERVVLHGNWTQTLADSRFIPISHALQKENIRLELHA